MTKLCHKHRENGATRDMLVKTYGSRGHNGCCGNIVNMEFPRPEIIDYFMCNRCGKKVDAVWTVGVGFKWVIPEN